MSVKPTSPFKGLMPTVVLPLIIVLFAEWYFLSGLAAQAATGTQIDDIVTGIVLILVGFIAGVLGGLIGTGGCSVMLSIIHFWMGYPVWAQDLVTVLLIPPPKFGRLPGRQDLGRLARPTRCCSNVVLDNGEK